MIEATVLRGIRRIASRANPRIKEWAGLKEKSDRDALGLTMAEGARLAGEALAGIEAGLYRPVAFLVSDQGAAHPEAGSMLDQARLAGLHLFNLSDDCFAKISSLKSPEGLAVILSFADSTPVLAELFASADARWLIAAGVQDPGNAGALARTALAAGFSGCLYVGGTDPRSPKFLRGSMGASFHLPCLSLTEEEFVRQWQPTFPRLYAATAHGEALDFRQAGFNPPFCLALGGEKGLSEAMLDLAEQNIHIQLHGGVESLNLAVAAGILLFEAEKHRQTAL